MGENDNLVKIIQLHGFFWDFKDQSSFKKIFEIVGYERLRNVAYKHVIEITNIFEGRTTNVSINMVKKLFLNDFAPNLSLKETSAEVRRKMWNYRTWLVKNFDLSLPKEIKNPVYIFDDTNMHKSRKFSKENIEQEIHSADPNSYFAGFIISD